MAIARDNSANTGQGSVGGVTQVYAMVAASFKPNGTIAFDNSSDLTLATSTATYTKSYTVNSNTNGILFVGLFASTSDQITGVTYAGVAMTQIGKTHAGTDRWVYLYYLLAPTTGANNVVASFSASQDAIQGMAVSYTGAFQSGQPDASVTGTGGSYVSPTVTVVASGCWIVAVTRNNSGTPSAGTTGTAMTARHTSSNGIGLFHSNATVSTGANVVRVQNNQGCYSKSYTVNAITNGGILFLTMIGGLSDLMDDAFYGGVQMTLIAKGVQGGGERYAYLYYLLNPPTGANNFAVHSSGVGLDFNHGMAASYTGVYQGALDNSTTHSQGSGTSNTISLTTVKDNCWTFLGIRASATPAAGTGASQLQSNANGIGIYDNNGAVTPPGSTSMQITYSTAVSFAIMASFAPSVIPAMQPNLGLPPAMLAM